MLRVRFSILSEPTGDTYRQLLDCAIRDCTDALVVVREELGLDEVGTKCLEILRPEFKMVERGARWPGTELLTGTAQIYRLRFSLACCETLKTEVDGLFGWKQPERPEDLCLLRRDGSPWLVTISHERDGYLDLSQEEAQELIDLIPALQIEEEEPREGQPSV